MKQTTVRFSKETERQIKQLSELLDLPSNMAVIRSAISQVLMIEIARRQMQDAEFVGFLAEFYRPLPDSG